MSESILIQVIQSAGVVLSAILPFVFIAIIRKRKETQKKLYEAQQDILFLLEAEKRYGEVISFHEGATMKNTIRNRVRVETNLSWSGKNTASNIDIQYSKSDNTPSVTSLV